MIRRTMEFEDESELSAAAQAVAMARELKKVADAAPDGHVLAVVEMATLEWGRRFTRERFQGALNAQAAALEQKGGAAGPPLQRVPAEPRHGDAAGRHRRRRCDAAAGPLHVLPLPRQRPPAGRPPRGRRPGQPARPAALVRGRGRPVVRGGGAVAPRAGRAERLRQHRVRGPAPGSERAPPRVGHSSRRRGMSSSRPTGPASTPPAAGARSGWRSSPSGRPRGRPVVDLDDWDEQRLPAPTARVATAAIRTGKALGPQWRRAAARLGIKRSIVIRWRAVSSSPIWELPPGQAVGGSRPTERCTIPSSISTMRWRIAPASYVVVSYAD